MGAGSSSDEWKRNAPFLEKQSMIISKAAKQNYSHLARITINQSLNERSEIRCKIKIAYPSVEVKLIDQLVGLQSSDQDYIGIFKQLVEGLYQIHSLNLIGRSLSIDKIFIQNEIIIFVEFGYYYHLQFTPENTFRKFSTYESDFWLIAAIMWQILTGQRVFTIDQSQFEQIVRNYSLQLELESKGNKLKELLISMLQIYTSQRISILQVIDKLQLSRSEEMKQFYSNYKLQALVKQFKNSLNRDGYSEKRPAKMLVYNVNVKFVEYFYKLYIEIQLLILAFHLSFYYPSPNAQEIVMVDKLIIAKLFLLSKQLKQKVLLHKVPQQFRNQAYQLISNPEYENLKKQLTNSHNIVANLWQEQLTDVDRYQNTQIIQEKIQSLKYQTGNLTLPQRLLIGILRNSKINEIPMQKFKALTLKNIFMNELQNRI